MTQFQYDAIIKIICSGAPALADELCESFANVVRERNNFKEEVDELKKYIRNSKESEEE